MAGISITSKVPMHTVASLSNMEKTSSTAIQIEARINAIKELKDRIELLSKFHQVEILRILTANNVKINENKNGVFVNITFLDDAIIDIIRDYLSYVNTQEIQLAEIEDQKASLCKEFFT